MIVWVASSNQKTKVTNPKTGKSTGPVTQHNVFFTVAKASTEGIESEIFSNWIKVDRESSTHWVQDVYQMSPSGIHRKLEPYELVSGWSIMRGLVRAPSFHGNSMKHFFPWVMAPTLESEMARDIYALATELAERYNVPLGPFEQAMAPTILNPWHHKNLVGLDHTITEK